MKRLSALLLATVTVAAAGCSAGTGSAGPAAADASNEAAIRVVASTDVYGDIVQVVGGTAVSVTSVIDNPDKDPHEYEADAQTQLALSKAQLVVENGGGYDDFVATMLAARSSNPTLVDVTELSGYDTEPAEGEFNEHLWYDLPTVVKLTDRLSSDLAALAPDQAATFTANAAAFTDRLTALQQDAAKIKKDHQGEGVAITEPVPLYLLEAAGLSNKTPDEFSEAIEEGTDVPPAVLAQTLSLFDGRQVELLAANEQTGGPQTEAVVAAADKNAIPVVGFTETLPAGETYLSWMQKNLDAVSEALDD